MAVNRLLYLGLLVLSAVFYFASGIWVAWLLLVLTVSLPLLSFLLSLPSMLSCRLEAVMPETVGQGEQAAIHLQLRAWRFPPLPEVQIRLNLRTRDQEKDLRYLSRLTRAEGVLALDTTNCGFLSAEFRRGRVYDALGLFRLPLRTPKLAPMAIVPPERQPVPMPQLDQFLQQHMKPKPGGGSAETYDNRAYRPGDPVKDIHWKLSLKTDTLVVREPLEPVKRRMILALYTPYGPEDRAVNLGNLRWLSHRLTELGVDHEAAWMEGDELRRMEIHSDTDRMKVLRSACLAPESSAELPWPLGIQADWICHVGRKGGQDA